MKKAKKVNPYEKKQQRRIRITRKQWTTIVSVLAVVAVLVGIIMLQQCGDPHAGHDHSTDDDNHTVATDEHGHAAGSHD